MQRIELAVTWTSPGKGRFRSKSLLTLISTSDGSRFAYLTYQVPEPASPALEARLAGVLRSYRAPDPR